MSNHETILEAFDSLRALCDPRGHALLEALEQMCLVNEQALDYVHSVAPVIPARDVLAAIEDYGWSKKVEA